MSDIRLGACAVLIVPCLGPAPYVGRERSGAIDKFPVATACGPKLMAAFTTRPLPRSANSPSCYRSAPTAANPYHLKKVESLRGPRRSPDRLTPYQRPGLTCPPRISHLAVPRLQIRLRDLSLQRRKPFPLPAFCPLSLPPAMSQFQTCHSEAKLDVQLMTVLVQRAVLRLQPACR
jgi:hypothetical protein